MKTHTIPATDLSGYQAINPVRHHWSTPTVLGYSVVNYIERYEVLLFIDRHGIIHQSDKIELPNNDFAQGGHVAWHEVPTLPRKAEFIGNYRNPLAAE